MSAKDAQVDCRLALLGNVAADDPEGTGVRDFLLSRRGEDGRIIVFQAEDTALVNVLQRQAAVVLQQSIREGLELTVLPRPCGKARPSSAASAVRYSMERTAFRSLPPRRRANASSDRCQARTCGGGWEKKQKRQCARFLVTRYLEQYLDLFGSFEASHQFRSAKASPAGCEPPKRAASDRADRR